jgi:hypothetical protein
VQEALAELRLPPQQADHRLLAALRARLLA